MPAFVPLAPLPTVTVPAPAASVVVMSVGTLISLASTSEIDRPVMAWLKPDPTMKLDGTPLLTGASSTAVTLMVSIAGLASVRPWVSVAAALKVSAPAWVLKLATGTKYSVAALPLAVTSAPSVTAVVRPMLLYSVPCVAAFGMLVMWNEATWSAATVSGSVPVIVIGIDAASSLPVTVTAAVSGASLTSWTWTVMAWSSCRFGEPLSVTRTMTS